MPIHARCPVCQRLLSTACRKVGQFIACPSCEFEFSLRPEMEVAGETVPLDESPAHVTTPEPITPPAASTVNQPLIQPAPGLHSPWQKLWIAAAGATAVAAMVIALVLVFLSDPEPAGQVAQPGQDPKPEFLPTPIVKPDAGPAIPPMAPVIPTPILQPVAVRTEVDAAELALAGGAALGVPDGHGDALLANANAPVKPEPIRVAFIPPNANPKPDIKPKADVCVGGGVEFVRNHMIAAEQAAKDKKLLFLIHISGNFEEAKFT